MKWIYPCLESISIQIFTKHPPGNYHIPHRGKRKIIFEINLERVCASSSQDGSPFLILFVGDLDIPNTWGIIIDWRHPPNRELYTTDCLPNGLLGYPYFGEPSDHLLNCSELIIWYVGFISWILPTNSSFPIKCWITQTADQTLNHSNGGFGALESWSTKLTKRIDIIIFKQARPVPDHFQVSMLLFVEGRCHLQCETTHFWHPRIETFAKVVKHVETKHVPKVLNPKKPTNTMEHGIIY